MDTPVEGEAEASVDAQLDRLEKELDEIEALLKELKVRVCVRVLCACLPWTKSSGVMLLSRLVVSWMALSLCGCVCSG